LAGFGNLLLLLVPLVLGREKEIRFLTPYSSPFHLFGDLTPYFLALPGIWPFCLILGGNPYWFSSPIGLVTSGFFRFGLGIPNGV